YVVLLGSVILKMGAFNRVLCPSYQGFRIYRETLSRFRAPLHRIMAFIVFTIIMITYIHAVKNYPNNRTVHYGYTAAFILVILQVITGALSIMTNVNLIIALFHALFITYLFGMTTYFIMLMLRSVRSDKQ
ncbi:COX15/CtaA family protein, partial [Staphylococcus aureus]